MVNENTIPLDKQMHFTGGSFVSIWGYGLSYNANEDRRKAKFWGIASGIIVGTAKELSDIGTTGFDVEDLAYTVGGSIVMTYTIDFLVGRRIHREKVLEQRALTAQEELERIEWEQQVGKQ